MRWILGILLFLTTGWTQIWASTAPIQTLTGDLIGTLGSWQDKGNTIAKAVDGVAGDYFDAPAADGDWVGYDLHTQFLPSSVSFAPRASFASRLVGGQIQGANTADFTGAITLLKIDAAPAGYAVYSLTNTAPVRYIRFLSPAGGFGNISRLSFSGVAYLPGEIGINAAGLNDPMIDLSLHPQYRTFFKAANLTTLRVWSEGGWKTHQPASYYHLLPAWHDAGANVIIVANFQNSSPRCSAPSDADWSGWCTAIPPPLITGAWAIEIGNEVNTTGYYAGSAQALAHLMQVAYPILHGKGYVVIGPSELNGLTWTKNLQSLGAFKYCDYINIHSYKQWATQIAADVDAAQVIAQPVGKPLAMTEWGTRNFKTPALWSAQQASAIGLLRKRNVLALSFPLYFLPGDTIDGASPFDRAASIQQPYYDAMVGAN